MPPLQKTNEWNVPVKKGPFVNFKERINIFLKHYLSGDTSSAVFWCFQCDIPWYSLQDYKSWSNQSCHPTSSMRLDCLDWLLCFWIFSSCILATWTSWGHGLIGAWLFNERSCKMQSRRPSQIERRLQYYLDDVSVKNESGTVRPQEHTSKNNCFSVWNVCTCRHLHAQEPPIYMYFSSSSVPYKEVACISPPFVPNEVSQECNEPKKSVPISCCKSEIWNPLHETSERLSAKLVWVDLTNPRQ